MNPELEAILMAYDALQDAKSKSDRARLTAIFESRLEDALEKYPRLTRDALFKAIEVRYFRWMKAQRKYSALPPGT